MARLTMSFSLSLSTLSFSINLSLFLSLSIYIDRYIFAKARLYLLSTSTQRSIPSRSVASRSPAACASANAAVIPRVVNRSISIYINV